MAAEALRYAVENGPGWVLSYLGGQEGVRRRIIARLDLAADAQLR